MQGTKTSYFLDMYTLFSLIRNFVFVSITEDKEAKISEQKLMIY